MAGTGITPTTLSYDPLGRLWRLVSPAQTIDWLYDGDAMVTEYGAQPHRYVRGYDDGRDWTNDAYKRGGHYNLARGYTANGLNLRTAAGAASLGYDAQGNITISAVAGVGTDSFGYSSENLLSSSTVASVSTPYQ